MQRQLWQVMLQNLTKKKEIIDKLRTQELCIEDMTRVFNLNAPLKMRYNLTFTTCDDIYKNKPLNKQ